MNVKRKLCLLFGCVLATIIFASSTSLAVAAPDAPSNPQVPSSPTPQAAPDVCLHLTQLQPDERKYRNVNNVPFTYDVSRYGGNWFNVACGDLAFQVSRGQEALVDLTAVAELDCQSTLPQPSNSWCGGRFLVNGLPLARPDNSGRGDTFAWDSANGGNFDWQANTLDMVYRAVCPREGNLTVPCAYRVQLQSRLENGATSLWLDDLKVTVDVTEGKVLVTTGPTTP